MRLLCLSYRPSNLWQLSGSERRFLGIYAYVQGTGTTCLVLQTPPLMGPKRAGIDTRIVDVRPESSLLASLAQWLLRGREAARSFLEHADSADLVYSTNNNLFNMSLGFLLAREMGIPFVAVAHHLRWVDYRSGVERFDLDSCYRIMRRGGLNILPAVERTGGAALEAVLLREADLLITVSSAVGETLRSTAPESRIEVVGNGVAWTESAGTESDKNWEGLYVGRIDEGKGVLDLLATWDRVVRRKHARLAVVGGGSLAPQARRLVSQGGLSNSVSLHGFVSDEQLRGFYRAARLFVSLSMTEGWGLALGEALIHGLPVVAFDIPPFREVWGSCAAVTLVPIGNLSAAADAIVRLLSLDIEEYVHLQREAKAFASQYRWDDVRKRELNALSRLMEQG